MEAILFAGRGTVKVVECCNISKLSDRKILRILKNIFLHSVTELVVVVWIARRGLDPWRCLRKLHFPAAAVSVSSIDQEIQVDKPSPFTFMFQLPYL